jgi:hypothetical protein
MGGEHYPLLINAQKSFGEIIDKVPTIDSI